MGEYRGVLLEFSDRLQWLVARTDNTITWERFQSLQAAYGLTSSQRSLFNVYGETVLEDHPPGTDRFSFEVISAVHRALCDLMYGV